MGLLTSCHDYKILPVLLTWTIEDSNDYKLDPSWGLQLAVSSTISDSSCFAPPV